MASLQEDFKWLAEYLSGEGGRLFMKDAFLKLFNTLEEYTHRMGEVAVLTNGGERYQVDPETNQIVDQNGSPVVINLDLNNPHFRKLMRQVREPLDRHGAKVYNGE